MQTVARGSSDIDDNTSQATLDDIFNMGYASWDWDISSTMRNELRYGLTRTQSNISIFGFFKTTGDGYKNAIRDQFSWQVDPKLSLFGGCDITAWPYDHFIAAPTPDGSIVRDTTHYFFGPAGVYASAEWKPIDNLTLMPGIRFDYYPELDYAGSLLPEFWDYDGFKNNQGISGEPALRLSTRYQLSQGHVVKGSIGTYSETPQPLGQAIHKTWGNPDLPASKAAQYVLGYEWQITDLDFADVQVYRNNQWDLARSPDSIELVADPTLKNYIGNGKGRMMGLEILLRHNQGPRFFGWIAYSLARSERYDYQNQKWAIYEKDILNNLQLVGSWKFPYQWEVGLRGRYTDGYPTTPITGAELNITQNRYVPEYGETNSDRMTPYIGLDMRISKTFIFDSWTLEAYTELINVAHIFRFVKDSKEQPLYEPPETGSYIWNYDYTEKRVLADIPRISFGMRVDF